MKNFTSYNRNILKRQVVLFILPVFAFVFSVQVAQAQAVPEVSWAMQFQGNSAEKNIIASDASGNVYVTGNFSGTVDFGDTTLTALGYNDVFLVKLDENNLSVGQNLSKEWKVYPNPVKDILTIELPEAMQSPTLEVFNMLGQKIKEFILLDNIQHLDLSELTQGIYLLKADNNVIKIKKQ